LQKYNTPELFRGVLYFCLEAVRLITYLTWIWNKQKNLKIAGIPSFCTDIIHDCDCSAPKSLVRSIRVGSFG
jgi:hypothetical protein